MVLVSLNLTIKDFALEDLNPPRIDLDKTIHEAEAIIRRESSTNLDPLRGLITLLSD